MLYIYTVYIPTITHEVRWKLRQACGNLVSRRRQGSQIALQRLEVAARWWEALRRLGSKLNTQAMGVMVMAYGYLYIYMDKL